MRSRTTQQLIRTDLCIIGAGSGGLSVAAGAAQMGASVVLVEKGKMGGDCLNTGCVPSKALIAAAKSAEGFRSSDIFGIASRQPQIDFSAVHAHVHSVIGSIAPHDSVERFEGLGASVIKGFARFVDHETVEAGDFRVQARRFVVATGSSAAVPLLNGLNDVSFMTNETVFELSSLPDHLIVVGGGPIGTEMTQAFRRLGSQVTLVDALGLLAKDEPEAVDIVRHRLILEGVVLRENTEISSVARSASGIDLRIAHAKRQDEIIHGTHLLIATGRKPNTDGLGLDVAGIETTSKGIKVDDRLRTTNKRVYAVGDIAGGPQFTHIASYQAGIVIRNCLFGLPAKVDYSALPWVTYTDPELAHVGLTEADARKTGGYVQILLSPFSSNDRAQAERETGGIAKIVLGRSGRILGATIVGPSAGELIGLWSLAISQKMKIGAVAGMILPYPTLSEISKRTAGTYYAPKLFSRRTRFIVRWLQKLLP